MNKLFIQKSYFFVIEMSQDLSQHYVDKLKRVEQKLDNLRKARLGQRLT